VAVEDILAFWKAALFAGRRRNEGLGRSVRVWRFLRFTERADDSGCPEVAEEGNAVGMRHKAHALDRCEICISLEDASFARSFDSCTLILTTHRGASHGGGADDSTSRLGKPTQVGRTSTGVDRTDVARLATCRCSRKGEDETR
jgi:hypothetical protein